MNNCWGSLCQFFRDWNIVPETKCHPPARYRSLKAVLPPGYTPSSSDKVALSFILIAAFCFAHHDIWGPTNRHRHDEQVEVWRGESRLWWFRAPRIHSGKNSLSFLASITHDITRRAVTLSFWVAWMPSRPMALCNEGWNPVICKWWFTPSCVSINPKYLPPTRSLLAALSELVSSLDRALLSTTAVPSLCFSATSW